MKQVLTLPENINEITLDQYQRFDKLNKRTDLEPLSYNKRVIEIFTELKYRDIGNISHRDYEDILEQLTKAMAQDVKFENRFKIEDVEFGFIPNLDEMTTAEFVDLSTHGLEVENFHKLMAVLFRPIIVDDSSWFSRLFGVKENINYEVESYGGTKRYSEVMKRMPMNIVNGALGFFYHLAKELRVHTLKFTREELVRGVKHQDTLISGDGSQPLTT